MFVSSSDERMIVREMTTVIRSTRTLSVLLVAVLRSGVQVLYMSRSLTALPTAHERPTAGLVELKRPWTPNYGGSRYGLWEMVVSVCSKVDTFAEFTATTTDRLEQEEQGLIPVTPTLIAQETHTISSARAISH